jgi:hypothetical protein
LPDTLAEAQAANCKPRLLHKPACRVPRAADRPEAPESLLTPPLSSTSFLFGALLLLIRLGHAAPFSVGLEPDFNSRYVWRGIVEEPMPVLQPSLWLSGYDFTLTGWGNLTLGPDVGPDRFNELDVTLDYTRAVGDLSLEPSLAYYLYPTDPGSSTGEASLRLEYPVGPLSLFTAQTFDILAYPGAYFGTAGVGLERDLWGHDPNRPDSGSCPQFATSLAVELSLGWASARFNDAYLGFPRTALNLAQCDVGISFDILDLFYVRPHITGGWLIDPVLSATAGGPWQGSAGLAVGREF